MAGARHGHGMLCVNRPLEEKKSAYSTWLGSLMKIGHFGDLGIDIRMILKNLRSRRGLDPCGLREVCVAGCAEHDNSLRRL
jgi:hypothetical protein